MRIVGLVGRPIYLIDQRATLESGGIRFRSANQIEGVCQVHLDRLILIASTGPRRDISRVACLFFRWIAVWMHVGDRGCPSCPDSLTDTGGIRGSEVRGFVFLCATVGPGCRIGGMLKDMSGILICIIPMSM